MTKLKKKTKLWQNSRTRTVIKLKKQQIVTKRERSNCDQTQNSNCAKLERSNCDNSKTQIVIEIRMTVVTEVVIMTSLSKNTLTP